MSKLGSLGFQAGFFGAMSKSIEDRRKEVQEKVAAARERAQKSAVTLKERRARADQALAYAKSLQTLGFTDDQIKGVIGMGPDAVQTTLEAATKTLSARGIDKFTPGEADTFIKLPPELRVPGGTLEEYTRKSYGADLPAATDTPEKGSLFETLFGSPDKIAERELAKPEYEGGISVTDLNTAADTGSDYTSLAPGAVVIPPKAEKEKTPASIASEYLRLKRDYVKEYGETPKDEDGMPLFGADAEAAKQRINAEADKYARGLIEESYGPDAMKGVPIDEAPTAAPTPSNNVPAPQGISQATWDKMVATLRSNPTPQMMQQFDAAMKNANIQITANEILNAQ